MAEPLISHDPQMDGQVVDEKQMLGRPVGTYPSRSGRPKPPKSQLDWILEHQIEVSSSLILAVVSFHLLFSPAQEYTRKILQLSYPSKDQQTYKQGPDDLYFVAGWVVTFTALRAISIDWLLRPLAEYLKVPRKNHLRMAEQGWMVIYYGIFWTLGMYIWIQSPYWLDHKALWTNWPTRNMSGLFKWYYLVQFSFWVQQIAVIHMEARRKDHAQMLTHHIITCTLMVVTYVYRYSRAANVVLCLMDLADLLIPIAKILRYLGHETACNVAFGVFVITWFIARHVMYLQLCYSIYVNVPGPDTMYYGCYSGVTDALLPEIPAQPDYFAHLFWPFQDLDGVVCLNTEVKWIFLGMLLMLQTLSIIWFGMIIKIIVGILRGRSAEDTRSDDEEEAMDELDVNDIDDTGSKRRAIDVTDLNVCVDGGSASSSAGSASSSTGSNRRIAAMSPRPTTGSARRGILHGEKRKELLARIGCEKPQQDGG